MTAPVWVPARQPALSWPHPLPGRSRRRYPVSKTLRALGPQLGANSSAGLGDSPRGKEEAQDLLLYPNPLWVTSRVSRRGMSLSGHLCLFTIVGLLLPTTGQTQPVTTPISRADSTPVNTRVLTSPVHPELQPVPLTPTPQADEASPPPPENQTQQPTSMDVHLTLGPGPDKSSTEADPTKGITLSQKPPGKAFATDPDLGPTGSSEDNPFFYDETTLRRHGLLVAAVLFITGIIILTSGKCRQFSQLCRNYNRAYRIVTRA